MKPILSFERSSNTIRQLPENYLIAHWLGDHPLWGRWICDPDPACDRDLAVKVFLELFNFDSAYEKDGLVLLSKITPSSK
jgi:hypothetical protein